jgi:transcriptional regulator with XRE-family HTH domain
MIHKKGTKQVAKLIKDRREELNYSRPMLQKKLGIESPNFVGMIETGAAKFPDTKVWVKWADALEIPRRTFLEAVIEDLHPEYLAHLRFKKEKKETSEPTPSTE